MSKDNNRVVVHPLCRHAVDPDVGCGKNLDHITVTIDPAGRSLAETARSIKGYLCARCGAKWEGDVAKAQAEETELLQEFANNPHSQFRMADVLREFKAHRQQVADLISEVGKLKTRK